MCIPKQKLNIIEEIPHTGYTESLDVLGELQQYQNGQKRTEKAERKKMSHILIQG